MKTRYKRKKKLFAHNVRSMRKILMLGLIWTCAIVRIGCVLIFEFIYSKIIVLCAVDMNTLHCWLWHLYNIGEGHGLQVPNLNAIYTADSSAKLLLFLVDSI